MKPLDDEPPVWLPGTSMPRLEIMARRLCTRLGWSPNSDVIADCCLEAILLLWRLRERLQQLPEGDRPIYAGVCMRNAMWRVLRCERQEAQNCVSLDRPCESDAPLIEFLASPPAEADVSLATSLLESIQDPCLASALRALSKEDRRVLQLCYQDEMTDSAIAAQSGRSPDAVRMRRNRALGKLREMLRHQARK